MHLLNKDTPFMWDKRAQESFDALKKILGIDTSVEAYRLQ
jgi:hypothetical protein